MIKKDELFQGNMFVEIPLEEIKGDKIKIKIGVYNDGELIETTKTTFLGPRTFN